MDDESFDSTKDQEYLDCLKSIRQPVNWESAAEREYFYRQFCSLIGRWESRLPNLREVFAREEIDWLLRESVNFGPVELISSVIRTGYRDEPELDEDGKPLLLRTTAVHEMAYSLTSHDAVAKLRMLFEIYNFNVNYISESGWTHFHVACMYGCEDIIEKFLELGQDPNFYVPIAKMGPPLQMSIDRGLKKVTELLLRRGANPNLATEEGLTPLHIICKRKNDDDALMKIFFEINEEINQLVQIDARDKLGDTPLHLALRKGNKMSAESLLRRGADSNIANKEGFTPLHEICLRDQDDDLIKIFFKINKEKNQTVQIDSSDMFGRTPLNLAVTNLMPNTVDVLLDRGADLSSFVFPNYSNFCNMLNKKCINWDNLRLASGILLVVERLENREYQLNWNDALTIINLFDDYRLSEKSWYPEKLWQHEMVQYGLFKKSWNFEECCNDEEFMIRAKKIIIIHSLSLYDLIQLRPEEEEKQLTYTDYFEIKRSKNLDEIPGEHFDACISHLCEKMSRGYFQRLALDNLRELSRDRLPILCYKKIIEELKNEDLFKICQAGELLAKENGVKIGETVSKGNEFEKS